ncbi:hypothetical protein PoB_000803900 [Plakobranchus ocellatus]|uniref:Secreted protein n=1 Tax=Plakobranchus ocellatus TaxID=259542 RepID=A0AAV3YHQ3_9GAST|nr:hypothetical protein PoB_000803900 [Plakobranchus ocellatus]
MLISMGRSSGFLLLATETATRAASVQGLPARDGAQPRGHVARISSAVPGLPWSYTPSRGCGTSTGIDPSPIRRNRTSRLCSVCQRCPPVLVASYDPWQPRWSTYFPWTPHGAGGKVMRL